MLRSWGMILGNNTPYELGSDFLAICLEVWFLILDVGNIDWSLMPAILIK